MPTNFSVSRRYTFAAAHRLEGHPKCGRLHGHNYVVIVELSSEDLEYGMVADYGQMDEIIKPLVDQFDHRYIISRENRDHMDQYAITAMNLGHDVDLPASRSTAENIARYLYQLILVSLIRFEVHDLKIRTVIVQESEKSSATYSEE